MRPGCEEKEVISLCIEQIQNIVAGYFCDCVTNKILTGNFTFSFRFFYPLDFLVSRLKIIETPLVQLGQPSVNPPRLVLEVGGTSTLQAAMPVKLKSPPLQGSKWGGLQLSRHGCLLS